MFKCTARFVQGFCFCPSQLFSDKLLSVGLDSSGPSSPEKLPDRSYLQAASSCGSNHDRQREGGQATYYQMEILLMKEVGVDRWVGRTLLVVTFLKPKVKSELF